MTEPVLNISQSVSLQAWKFRCDDEAQIDALVQQAGLDQLTARLLAGRNIDPDGVDRFLTPKLRDQMPDPSSLEDMDKAASLILDAVQARKKITVFADYDVDGGTSAAQLIRWGRALGAEFGLYVPDRIKEGYGPSVEAFKTLKANGTDLVITVDCGAAAHAPLHEAVDLDLPIIVVDHHLMEGDMPPSAALVNPNRPDDESELGHLAAAGVTFLLVAALNREARRRGLETAVNPMDLLGLTALGTICDVMPLTGLNRVFAAQGLKMLSKGNIVGLSALADTAEIKPPYTTYHAGFILGPRINAGGRIGRADMGAELLSTENSQLAYGHAAELDRVNQERKLMQDDILREAMTQVASDHDEEGLIIASMEGWHPGVIGIVAGRLKDRFNRPSIVIAIDDEGIGKGSGRSIKGVDLGGAIVAAKKEGLLEAGGGHAMAAGLTVQADRVSELWEFLNESLQADITAARANLGLRVDSLLSPSAVSQGLMETINKVGPFGAGNPAPVFVFPDLRINYAQRLRGGHVRCSFTDSSGARVNGICFGADENGLSDILLSSTNPVLHVAGRLKQDRWQGRNQITLNVVDLALSEPHFS